MGAVHTSSYDAVMITATDTAAVDADKLAGLKNFSKDVTVNMTNDTYLGDAVETEIPGTMTVAFSGDGQTDPADSVQSILRSSFEANEKVYLTVIEDESATAGDKGKRYPVYVSSYNTSFAQGDVVTFDFTLSLAKGTITAV